MLVLSRKKEEEIVVGSGDNAMVVTVLEITAGRVRLGFTGPTEVPVRRSELPPPSIPSSTSKPPKEPVK